MKSWISTLLKGMFVGGTMLVPGVSGGSMAMILGIYDRLISAISSFFKSPKRNFLFLAVFVLGAGTGMLLFAKPLEALIEKFPRVMMYLFLGAVAGGVPMIYKKAQITKASVWQTGWMLLGLLAVVAIAMLPEGLFTVGGGWQAAVLLAVAGFVAAIALILPGISVSYLLLVLGLYDKIIAAIGNLDILFLLPLAVGLLLGIVLTTRTLETAMNRYPKATYLTILGFILASMVQAFPGLPVGWEWPLCIVLAAAGFAAIRWISGKEEE